MSTFQFGFAFPTNPDETGWGPNDFVTKAYVDRQDRKLKAELLDQMERNYLMDQIK